jgi:probable HAF family extracellular repeat protein
MSIDPAESTCAENHKGSAQMRGCETVWTRTPVALACLLVAWSGCARAQTYRATDLGANTYGQAINNAGQIAGYYVNAAGVNKPFIWTHETLTDLETLGGSAGQAFGINSSGQVVGQSNLTGDATYHATLWSNGTITDLGTLGGQTSSASGINDSGDIVGISAITPTGPVAFADQAAFLFSGGVLSNLSGISNNGTASAINDSGSVVGFTLTPLACDCVPEATLWQSGSATTLPYASLSTGQENGSYAYAINGAGQIAGMNSYLTVSNSVTSIAVSWNNGTSTAIGSGTGYGINNSGQIVGSPAFLWTGSQYFDLNALLDQSSLPGPFSLSSAVGINDSGLILAIGNYASATHTFLLQLETLTLSVTPASITFGSFLVGKPSTPQPVTVGNTGTTAFGFNPIQTSGDFSQTSNCGASLAAGASCTIQVSFDPTTAGNRTGILTVASGGTSYPVNLTGTGLISASISASATSGVMVGSPVKLTWTSTGTACSATGGQSGDGWTGSLSASGSQSVSESTAGTFTYGVNCTGGGQTATAQVTVSVAPPAVNLSASPNPVTVGQVMVLTWTSTLASSCTASGGGTADGWAGTKPTSGTAAITESAAANYTYTLVCSAGGQSAQAQAVVTVNPKPSSGGGGGAFDELSLLYLLSAVGLRLVRRFEASVP